jgi:hypothetical protein
MIFGLVSAKKSLSAIQNVVRMIETIETPTRPYVDTPIRFPRVAAFFFALISSSIQAGA